jgi:predicted permease
MSSPGSDLSSTIISTFIASIKSVGTACTLAGVGIYLHQRGFVIGNGKRTLALISQQVTIPLLFFTKILYCNQNSSTEPCPNVTSSLRDAWILLIWPLWVCSIGLCVGYVVVFLGNITCKQKRNAIMVSIAFGNCTGLPITLLTVIHSNFDNHSKLGIVDPTLFLSVYLVIYPVLQWGIGGMMLSPSTPPQSTTTTTTTAVDEIDKEKKVEDETLLIDNDSDDEEKDENDDSEGACSIAFKQNSANSTTSSTRESLREVLTSTTRALVQNVINQKNTRAMSMSYKIHNRGLASVDASMYMSVPENLNEWGMPIKTTFHNQNGNSNKVVDIFDGDGKQHHYHHQRIISEIDEEIAGGTNNNNMDRTEGTTETETSTSSSFLIEPPKEHDALLPKTSSRSPVEEEELEEDKDKVNLCTTILSIIIRCLQPPVIGALLGTYNILCTSVHAVFMQISVRTNYTMYAMSTAVCDRTNTNVVFSHFDVLLYQFYSFISSHALTHSTQLNSTQLIILLPSVCLIPFPLFAM